VGQGPHAEAHHGNTSCHAINSPEPLS
jgi:hypothetical protein